MKLTINADDFGKDENATLAIAESFRRGFITQTTLMVNMPWADKAVELARREGFSEKVGLHLNLTEGKPLTAAMACCEVFCDAEGEFRGRQSTSEEVSHEEVRHALIEEVEAQVRKYLGYGLPLMHCDGHHHVQTRLHIAKVVMSILEKHGFKSIRRPNNVWNNKGLHVRSRIQQLLFARLSRKHGLELTDRFSGWSDGLDSFGRKCTLEVMVHPRYDGAGALVDIQDFKNNRGRPMQEIVDLVEAFG